MTRLYTVLALLGLLALAVHATGDNDSADARPSITCNPLYTSTQSCQNFARVCLNEINDQIRMELTASYTYQAMAAYYGRDDVAYRGFAKFFSAMADEEREHAKKLQDYMVQRGGRVHFKSIPAVTTEWQTPLHGLREALTLEKRVNNQLLDLHWLAQQKNDPHAVTTEWQTPLHGLREALTLEKRVNNQLLDLHWLAQQKNDPHLQNFLEGEFLTEQVESAKQLSDWVSVMTRLEGDTIGWTLFDEELYTGQRK